MWSEITNSRLARKICTNLQMGNYRYMYTCTSCLHIETLEILLAIFLKRWMLFFVVQWFIFDGFSSPELISSYQNLSGVCLFFKRCRCRFFTRTIGSFSTNIYWVNEIQTGLGGCKVQMKGRIHYFPRGNNSHIVKKHWQLLKIIFSITTVRPNKRGTKYMVG